MMNTNSMQIIPQNMRRNQVFWHWILSFA